MYKNKKMCGPTQSPLFSTLPFFIRLAVDIFFYSFLFYLSRTRIKFIDFLSLRGDSNFSTFSPVSQDADTFLWKEKNVSSSSSIRLKNKFCLSNPGFDAWKEHSELDALFCHLIAFFRIDCLRTDNLATGPFSMIHHKRTKLVKAGITKMKKNQIQ